MRVEQRARLNELLGAILPSNRFYAAKLGERPPATGDLAALPFTTKSELIEDQRVNPPYGSNLTYPADCYTRFAQTSGTTGAPMRWLDTPQSWAWMLDCWQRVFESAGITRADRLFFAFSFGPFLGFWTAFESAARMGCLCIPGGGMRSVARLRVILDNCVTALCCTPTYAIHLAEAAAEEGIDLGASRVRTIFVAGEPGGSVPGTRARIEQLWPGARVVDQHGMTEIGPVTYGCPARPNVLHVIESGFIAEVVDPASGAAVAPGTPGELVLTNLGRTGSPLIRYRTGDLVRTGPVGRCACGSEEMAFEGGIIGRTDDMVLVRGVNVYPSAVEDVVRSCGGVAEYRVRVSTDRSMAELALEVEPDPACADVDSLEHRISSALRDSLSLRIPVIVVARGTLPRFEMKARRWVVER